MNESADILTGLMNEFREQLPTPVFDHLKDLVVHNEYGVAFEELCAYLGEENIAVDARQLKAIQDLGAVLGIDSSWWSKLAKK